MGACVWHGCHRPQACLGFTVVPGWRVVVRRHDACGRVCVVGAWQVPAFDMKTCMVRDIEEVNKAAGGGAAGVDGHEELEEAGGTVFLQEEVRKRHVWARGGVGWVLVARVAVSVT